MKRKAEYLIEEIDRAGELEDAEDYPAADALVSVSPTI